MPVSTKWILPILLLTVAGAGCSSMPKPKSLVPIGEITPKQIESLSKAAGSPIDVFTVSGQETFILLESVTDGALSGERVDPVSAQPVHDQSVSIPLKEAALVYYAELPTSTSRHANARAQKQPQGLPVRYSYPELASVRASDKLLTCTQLDAALSRAAALRWFARNEGLMGYTPGQAMAHHAVTTVEVAAITFVVLAAGAGGSPGSFNFSGPPTPAFQTAPMRNLRDQVGSDQLRWAITAADVRITGLLHIKRDQGCPPRSTMADGQSDLQMLQQFDALHVASATQRLSGVALLHEETRLLDLLGPRALPDGRLADCGVYRCDNSTDQGETSDAVMEVRRLLPDLASERVQHVFGNAVWYGETATVMGRAKMQSRLTGNLVLFDRSVVFTSASTNEPGAATDSPPPVRIPYGDIASVEVGNFVLNRWVSLRNRDGHAHFFAIKGHADIGIIDRAQTKAAGDLIQSELRVIGRKDVYDSPGVITANIEQ